MQTVDTYDRGYFVTIEKQLKIDDSELQQMQLDCNNLLLTSVLNYLKSAVAVLLLLLLLLCCYCCCCCCVASVGVAAVSVLLLLLMLLLFLLFFFSVLVLFV